MKTEAGEFRYQKLTNSSKQCLNTETGSACMYAMETIVCQKI